jgi:hypothetical protein
MIATSEAEQQPPINLSSNAEDIPVASLAQNAADHEIGTDENDHELDGRAQDVTNGDEESDPTDEISPHGRYVKRDTRLGSGAYKDVYVKLSYYHNNVNHIYRSTQFHFSITSDGERMIQSKVWKSPGTWSS